jgi:hypothetical protein
MDDGDGHDSDASVEIEIARVLLGRVLDDIYNIGSRTVRGSDVGGSLQMDMIPIPALTWTRGKKGRREAISVGTGATYVYADEILRVARTKGAWSNLGTFPDLDAAQRAAQDYDQLLAVQCVQEAMEQANGLMLAKKSAELRDLYRDVVTQGTLRGVYRAYCNLRKNGYWHWELIDKMEALNPVSRAYLGRAFEDFYNAGMRER